MHIRHGLVTLAATATLAVLPAALATSLQPTRSAAESASASTDCAAHHSHSSAALLIALRRQSDLPAWQWAGADD